AHEDGVAIAISADFADRLEVAAGCALNPDLAAAATEERRPAGTNRLLECFARLPGEHEHFARGGVLDDARHEPAVVVLQLVGANHLNPPAAIASGILAARIPSSPARS